MNFTEGEIAYLNELRALTMDADGGLIFVGLTSEESSQYLELSRRMGGNSYESGERYLELHEKHEIARLRVIAAESEARRSGASFH